jgi:hypothetical protein
VGSPTPVVGRSVRVGFSLFDDSTQLAAASAASAASIAREK